MSSLASVLRKFTPDLRRASGAVALALLLAACGGGGGGEPAPTATSAQPNPVAAYAAAQQSVGAPSAPAPGTPAQGNMLANGSFESGTTGWIDWGNTAVVAGEANSGASALRIGPGAGGAGQEVDGIVPGNTYRLTAQAKVSAASETVYVGVNFIDASGTPFTQNSVLVDSTGYTTARLDVVAPPSAVGALVYAWKNAGSGVAEVDAFSFEVVGGSTRQVASSANMVANGGFESGLANWTDWGNASTSVPPPFAPPAAGSHVAQVGTGAGGIGQEVGNVVGGKSYRVSALARVSVQGEIGYLGVMFMDATGRGLLAQNAVVRSTSYSTVQADVTAPAGATKALVFAWKNAGSGYAYVDEVSLVEVTPLAPGSGSPVVLANANTTGSGVAVLKNGLRVAGWSDQAGVHTQLFDVQGGLVGSTVNIAPGGTFTGVAPLAGGGYVVEYDQPGAVLVQVVGTEGTLAGAPAVVRTQAQVEAELGCCQSPKLAGGTGVYALGNGGFAAEFRETHLAHIPGDYPGSILVQLYDATGSAVGAPKAVAEEALSPSTTTSTWTGGLMVGSTVLCPCAAGGIAQFQVFDDTLKTLTGLQSPLNESTRSQRGAQLTSGAYVAIWTVNSYNVPPVVKGEISVPGGGFPPVLTFADVGPDARLTALAGGGFLLSWGTSAQVFDAAGKALGGVMQILDGSIAATPDGGFVVVAQVGSQLVAQQYAVGP